MTHVLVPARRGIYTTYIYPRSRDCGMGTGTEVRQTRFLEVYGIVYYKYPWFRTGSRSGTNGNQRFRPQCDVNATRLKISRHENQGSRTGTFSRPAFMSPFDSRFPRIFDFGGQISRNAVFSRDRYLYSALEPSGTKENKHSCKDRRNEAPRVAPSGSEAQ